MEAARIWVSWIQEWGQEWLDVMSQAPAEPKDGHYQTDTEDESSDDHISAADASTSEAEQQQIQREVQKVQNLLIQNALYHQIRKRNHEVRLEETPLSIVIGQ